MTEALEARINAKKFGYVDFYVTSFMRIGKLKNKQEIRWTQMIFEGMMRNWMLSDNEKIQFVNFFYPQFIAKAVDLDCKYMGMNDMFDLVYKEE